MTSNKPLLIRILKCDLMRFSKWNHPFIKTPFWRVLWCKKTGWATRHLDKRFPLHPRQLVVITPNAEFSTQGQTQNTHFFLEFTAGPPFGEVKPHLYAIPLPAWIKTQIENWSEEMALRPSMAFCHQLASFVLSHVDERLAGPNTAHPKILQALRLLRNTTDRRIDNAELGKLAGMHTSSFISLFHKEIGLTPQDWHVKQRIAKACELLNYTAFTIEKIASETGFHDRYHLSRVFKKFMKIGPAAFRKKHDTKIFLP